MKTRTLILIAATLLVASCGNEITTKQSVGLSTELTDQIHKMGMVTFRSNAGEWKGRDNDYDLVFMNNGQVAIVTFSNGINLDSATYSIDKNDVVRLDVGTESKLGSLKIAKSDGQYGLTPWPPQDLGKLNIWPFLSIENVLDYPKEVVAHIDSIRKIEKRPNKALEE